MYSNKPKIFGRKQQLYLRCSSKYVPSPQALGYTLGKTIECGKFSKVKAAWSPFENRMISIKLVRKTEMSEKELDKFLPREIAILQKISHPNILDLYQIIETDKQCFLAYELAQNGTLLDYMNLRVRLPEQEARFIFHQICKGLSYCHSLGISHRDLKLENIFFTETMDIKIGDFAFSIDSDNQFSDTPCGSYSYCAPEILQGKKYNTLKADSWNVGVVLYAMVSGSLPFGEDNEIQKGQGDYRAIRLDSNLSDKLQSLIQELLTVNVASRPFIRDVLTYKWTIINPSTKPPQSDPKSCKYTIENCLPSFLHTIRAENLLSSDVDPVNVVMMPYPQHQGQESQEVAVSADIEAVAPVQSELVHVSDTVMPPVEAGSFAEHTQGLASRKSKPGKRQRIVHFMTRLKAAGGRLTTLMRRRRH